MELHNGLSQLIHPSRVLTSYLHRIAYASDASYFRLVPQAVVQPESIGEIEALFQFTQQNKIPMTFPAAGTSLSGQAMTNGILVDISKHWGQFEVEKEAAPHVNPAPKDRRPARDFPLRICSNRRLEDAAQRCRRRGCRLKLQGIN